MADKREIAGKTAFVTGSNRGLGAALVEELLQRGAAKVYCGARDPSTLKDVMDRYGPRVEPVKLDLANPADIEAAAQRLTDLDILVSSAGITYLAPLEQTKIDEIREIMEINFFGPYQLILAFADTLRRNEGGFVYILSLASFAPAPDAELYSASKAAGMMLGHAVRHMLPNVAVSLSYPGSMDTDMMKDWDVPKTSPREIAGNTLDGWCAGNVSIFPDLHARYLREAVVGESAQMMLDPYVPMEHALNKFLATAPKAPA